jgi:alpha-methylacyl-CoA racemase
MLSSLRILEIAALGPVPWCGMLLADMGASIVRIDRPGTDAAHEDLDPTKRGRSIIVADLKSPEGHAAVLALVRHADVLMEGMRPGAMERLGLSPSVLLEANPRLVFARMTGWGQDGPLAPRAGHDINYIALSGALHAIGPAERPVPPLNLIGDYGGGGAFLAIGLLAAVLRARADGKGGVVDVAMVDGATSMMTQMYARLAEGRWTDERAANALDGGVPWYNVYKTKDGRFMAVGANEPQFYALLLEGLGFQPDEFPSRTERTNWPTIHERFATVFATRTRDEWTHHFEGSDACVTPVLSMTEAPTHAHLRARRSFAQWNGAPTPGAAPRFDATPDAAIAIKSSPVSLTEAIERWT